MPALPVSSKSADCSTASGESIESESTEYTPTTYRATLTTPLFYSSSEGRVIRTQKRVSATALMHALGYNIPEINLAKRYAVKGEKATQTTYDHLRDIRLFVSDMTPVDVSVESRTFHNTTCTTETRVQTLTPEVAEQLDYDDNTGVPSVIADRKSGWKRQRRYRGIDPGSTYRFTVWTPSAVSLHDTLRFAMGISRSGEFVAESTETVADSVSLNAYLLDTVYDHPVDPSEILLRADEYKQGNDPRLTHYTGVDTEWVDGTFF